MRIAFLDLIDHDYVIESVYQQPIGGSSSAVCYLAEALAKQGHDVVLLNKTTTPGRSRGVTCLFFDHITPEIRNSLDVLVIVNLAGEAANLRRSLNPKTRLMLWTGHAHDQPAMQGLHDRQDRSLYDGVVLVSEWQRNQFHSHFGLDLSRTIVLRNAISPVFCDRIPPHPSILAQKAQPPILAYTSTPFRGLNLLLEAFPKIRAAIPGTRLKVFSSMRVYNQSDADYESLYHQCQTIEGVEYIGSVPQPQLAKELASVNVLAYPNTFAETSCIAVMEAMAIGCWIVTSDLGALAETTAGFARLIPVTEEWETYQENFVAAIITVLTTPPDLANHHLRQQVNYANQHYIWVARAQEWIAWLEAMQAAERAIVPQAHTCFVQGDYTQAAVLFEQAATLFPNEPSHGWYLGLSLLLQGEVESAQLVWALALMESKPSDRALTDLVNLLQAEQQRQQNLGNVLAVETLQASLQELISWMK
jgi:glycosyltransferase involved in cell wall biosynthesis